PISPGARPTRCCRFPWSPLLLPVELVGALVVATEMDTGDLAQLTGCFDQHLARSAGAVGQQPRQPLELGRRTGPATVLAERVLLRPVRLELALGGEHVLPGSLELAGAPVQPLDVDPDPRPRHRHLPNNGPLKHNPPAAGSHCGRIAYSSDVRTHRGGSRADSAELRPRERDQAPAVDAACCCLFGVRLTPAPSRSEEHTSELQ